MRWSPAGGHRATRGASSPFSFRGRDRGSRVHVRPGPKGRKMSIGGYPAGPRGRRLVGNRYDYERDRIGFLQRCQRDYGDVFSFSARTSVVADPILVHEILARTNTDFGIEVALFDDAEPE